MDAQDKVLICKECGREFLFSTGEQAFYAEKGFQHEPTRCRNCRAVRKGRGAEGMSAASTRNLYPATCSDCGKETQVPFRPTPGKPVFCRDCFQRRGAKAPARRTPAYLEP